MKKSAHSQERAKDTKIDPSNERQHGTGSPTSMSHPRSTCYEEENPNRPVEHTLEAAARPRIEN
jgi:hypothetical protein